MDERDRTAIHEVMEQQTVSIAKAGITTTLNARTSILAAANPIYGRYDTSRSINQNINLPAALLSRFDLIFLLLDKPDLFKDELLALHIGNVHKNQSFNGKEFVPLESSFIRAFISKARQFEPQISPEIHNHISEVYIQKRRLNKKNGDIKPSDSYTTPRTLLALIRLSQAHAKLRFTNDVEEEDVEEAMRLMECSSSQVLEEVEREKQNIFRSNDKSSIIFNILKDIKNQAIKSEKSGDISFNVAFKRIAAKGYTLQDLEKTLETYKDLGVLIVSDKNETIQFV